MNLVFFDNNINLDAKFELSQQSEDSKKYGHFLNK